MNAVISTRQDGSRVIRRAVRLLRITLSVGIVALVCAGCTTSWPKSSLVVFHAQPERQSPEGLVSEVLIEGNGIYVGDGLVWTVSKLIPGKIAGWNRIPAQTYEGKPLMSRLVTMSPSYGIAIVRLKDPGDLEVFPVCSKPPVVGEKVLGFGQAGLSEAGHVDTILDSYFSVDRVLNSVQAGGAIVPESRDCMYGIVARFDLKAIGDGRNDTQVGQTIIRLPRLYAPNRTGDVRVIEKEVQLSPSPGS